MMGSAIALGLNMAIHAPPACRHYCTIAPIIFAFNCLPNSLDRLNHLDDGNL